MNEINTRYFIEIKYKGTSYHGWQIQKNALSVQEVLNQALETVLQTPIETIGCGRTDTGVHARQLYAHFDVAEEIIKNKESQIQHALNGVLPNDIAVVSLFGVHQEAHARFDAISRSYEYHIHFDKNPFLQDFSWQIKDKPDIEAMNTAAAYMLSYKDFGCFSKSNTQVFTNNCHISRAEWCWESNNQLVFYITADRFLRNMVRAIVGTLLFIGSGKASPESIKAIIESKSRKNAGTSVPANGLYLTAITYPYIED